MEPQQLSAFLILNNIGKRHNFGTLIRSAAAMGIQHIFVVGAPKLRTFGCQGTSSKVSLHFWDTLSELKAFLQIKGIEVCGVEIDETSEPLESARWTKDVAFMLGNEGTGMSQKQKDICDRFVYIPQYSGATASLNVAVAGGIVFHNFAVQSRLVERARIGEKFVVEERVHTQMENDWDPPTRSATSKGRCEAVEVEEGQLSNFFECD